jgi:hypothetical protein
MQAEGIDLRRVFEGVGHLLDAQSKVVHQGFQHRDGQLVLRFEIVVDGAGPDIGTVGDFQHRGGFDTLFRHDVARRRDQRITVAPLAARHAPFGNAAVAVHVRIIFSFARDLKPARRCRGSQQIQGLAPACHD